MKGAWWPYMPWAWETSVGFTGRRNTLTSTCGVKQTLMSSPEWQALSDLGGLCMPSACMFVFNGRFTSRTPRPPKSRLDMQLISHLALCGGRDVGFNYGQVAEVILGVSGRDLHDLLLA